ncbi:hypothetical protein AVEN_173434-1, partial [Araneus ventricosus]
MNCRRARSRPRLEADRRSGPVAVLRAQPAFSEAGGPAEHRLPRVRGGHPLEELQAGEGQLLRRQ